MCLPQSARRGTALLRASTQPRLAQSRENESPTAGRTSQLRFLESERRGHLQRERAIRLLWKSEHNGQGIQSDRPCGRMGSKPTGLTSPHLRLSHLFQSPFSFRHPKGADATVVLERVLVLGCPFMGNQAKRRLGDRRNQKEETSMSDAERNFSN